MQNPCSFDNCRNFLQHPHGSLRAGKLFGGISAFSKFFTHNSNFLLKQNCSFFHRKIFIANDTRSSITFKIFRIILLMTFGGIRIRYQKCSFSKESQFSKRTASGTGEHYIRTAKKIFHPVTGFQKQYRKISILIELFGFTFLSFSAKMQHLDIMFTVTLQRLRQYRIEYGCPLTASKNQNSLVILFEITAEQCIELVQRFTAADPGTRQQLRAHRHTDINDLTAALISVHRRESGAEDFRPPGEYPVAFTDTGVSVVKRHRNVTTQCRQQHRSHGK